MNEKNEIVLFTDNDIALEVPITPEKETVWLTQDQMSELFDTVRSSIAYHIGKIFKEGELERDTSVEIFDGSTNKASRPPQYYNLDWRGDTHYETYRKFIAQQAGTFCN